ncbi:MAG: hypothetical protein MUF18_08385 [Fimbriiglobus sp.]|nr:hypothetical protein [Fimbriiglobus sp.]
MSDQLKALFAHAGAEGVKQVAVKAAKWMLEELERTPEEFGESREYLPHADLHMRLAFVPPLFVQFGVHHSTRTVFISKIGWFG